MQSDPDIEPVFSGALSFWTFPPCLPGSDGDHPLPAVCMRRFDVAAYEPSAFSQARIACPQSVAHSVLKRQAEFLCGRIVARDAMRHLEIAAWREAIDIGASRQPLWPLGVTGSISHAGDVAAAIASHAGRHPALGLDVEQVVGGTSLDAIEAIAIDADERSLLERAGGSAHLDENMTLAFSAKESLFKAAFASVGRYFDFAAARVTTFDPAGRLTLTIAEPLGGGYELGRRCEIRFVRPWIGFVMTLYAPRGATQANAMDASP